MTFAYLLIDKTRPCHDHTFLYIYFFAYQVKNLLDQYDTNKLDQVTKAQFKVINIKLTKIAYITNLYVVCNNRL